MFTRRAFLQSALWLPSAFGLQAVAQTAASRFSFADFESGTYSDWAITGTAFGTRPATNALFPGKIQGFGGNGYVCTLHPRKGNVAIGRAVSRPFPIEKPFITFKIGGGNHPGQACINLVINNRIERTATGNNTPDLMEQSWDVSALVGKTAHLEIVDDTPSDNRGYILVDDIQFATETAPSAATDTFIREQMDIQKIPGVALAVSKFGQPALIRTFGWADRDNKIPVTTSTSFRLASVSKQFLACAALLLQQDGKLSIDDKVAKYLPDVPETWQTMTLRHVLSHTAGLMREGPTATRTQLQPDIEVIRAAYGFPLVFPPGQKYQYSNLGYFVVGEIIKIVAGMPWAEFAKQRIFLPCGMSNTHAASNTIPNRAVGYNYTSRNGEKVNPILYTALRPAAGFASTVEDMTKWDAALHTNQIVSEQSKKLLWTATRLNDRTASSYGLGWQIQHRRGLHCVEHGGLNAGFETYFLRQLSDGVSVVFLANSDKIDTVNVARQVARFYSAVP